MDNKKIREYEYVIPGQAEEITEVINKLLHILKKVDHNISDIQFRLELAAREMLANAIEYGCERPGDRIIVKLQIKSKKIVLIVKDPGEGFNWQECSFEIIPVRDDRGRGLKMINKVSDSMEFNDKGNLIKITFVGRE